MGIVEYAALAVIVYIVANVILKVTLVVGYFYVFKMFFEKDKTEEQSSDKPYPPSSQAQPEFDDIPF